MSARTIRETRRQLILKKTELQKQLLDIESQLLLCEMDAENELLLATAARNVPSSETESFIEAHHDRLEPGDLEFLEAEYRGTSQTVDFSGIPETTLRRLADAGKIQAKRVGRARQFQTSSVVGYLIDAQSQKEP